MNDEFMRQEVNEAIMAGERALLSLQAAKEKLDSARSWGILDLLGGGFLTGALKHSKMNDAAAYMEDAKRDLQIFEEELRDVRVSGNLNLEIGGFLTFADFFFDGIVADYLVQSKIAQARTEVRDTIQRVEDMLAQLKGLY